MFIRAWLPLTPWLRVQVGLVVIVASGFEVFASLIWGLYTYRLHNIPMFVPPGHGLVYLTGLHLSQSRLVTSYPRAALTAALIIMVGWAVGGLLLPSRPDVMGAIGAVLSTPTI